MRATSIFGLNPSPHFSKGGMGGFGLKNHLPYAILVFLIGLFFSGASWARSIQADKTTYLPRESVQVTGSGFAASRDFTVRVTAPDLTTSSDLVSIDSGGSFWYQYNLPGMEGRYTVDILSGKTSLGHMTFKAKMAGPCGRTGGEMVREERLRLRGG